MVYKSCGSVCQPTCDDPQGKHLCVEKCVEGCFCKEGMVADGAMCITADECGCVKDGILYQVEKIIHYISFVLTTFYEKSMQILLTSKH